MWRLGSADVLQGGAPELMHMVYEKVPIFDFLTLSTTDFTVRDSEQTLFFHHTSAIPIPPLSCLQYWKDLHFSCSLHGVLSLLWIILAFLQIFLVFSNSTRSSRCECTMARCSLLSIPFLIMPGIPFPFSAASEPLPNVFSVTNYIVLQVNSGDFPTFTRSTAWRYSSLSYRHKSCTVFLQTVLVQTATVKFATSGKTPSDRQTNPPRYTQK